MIHATALAELRAAHRAWRELEAPYQAARVRLQIGVACRELGDAASAELEFDAARGALEELGAAPDLKRLASAGRARTSSGGLSSRESEVLALVASGKTNRAIADRAFHQREDRRAACQQHLHEARLSSRSEATAYAFKHGLVR